MSTSSASISNLAKYKEKFFKKLFGNFHRILIFVCGSGLLVYGAYHMYHHFMILRNKALYETYLLNRKITSLYPKYKNLVLLKIDKKERFQDNSGLIFELFLREYIEKKPDYQENLLKKADPFLPPFEDSQFISDLSNTHNLLFNKFALAKNHVLVTTKTFEPQNSLLNYQDFLALVKTMKALEGFGFINVGEASGFSVLHKHLQVIPYSYSLYNGGVFEVIKERIKEKTLIGGSDEGAFLLKEFRFRHAIRLIDGNSEDNIEKTAENFLINYRKALETLENTDLKISYNAIFTEEWMMIVLRSKRRALETIGLNAMAYTGTIMVTDEADYEKVKKFGSGIKILEEISLF